MGTSGRRRPRNRTGSLFLSKALVCLHPAPLCATTATSTTTTTTSDCCRRSCSFKAAMYCDFLWKAQLRYVVSYLLACLFIYLLIYYYYYCYSTATTTTTTTTTTTITAILTVSQQSRSTSCPSGYMYMRWWYVCTLHRCVWTAVSQQSGQVTKCHVLTHDVRLFRR